ncbi:proline dehydrogenase family protein [Granulicella sibirica]|uniref:proline dehydrogenase n=1 Tax=Granulicella sibirica TaxID=2479048 RepID=A0A4Q0T0D2_9BACT|nr:proline dehydrogenase family protein [Granulicella sibirica]RXH55259.1 Proline dehydrogenase [Granulicella sibirica]
MLRSFFIALSTNKSMRAFSERSTIGRTMSSRFVAGMSVEEALSACEQLNREGIAASLDSLGESVATEAEAQKSAAIYFQLLDAIESRKLNANVSVKLTQMGMDFDPALAERIVAGMVERADRANSFVRIDMEGSGFTEATVAMTERLNARWPGRVGTVLQAYLFRTESDAERLIAKGIRIRLCKGAYKEPPEIAFPEKSDVDKNYVKLMERMVTSPVFCGIATHDEAIINALRRFVSAHNVPKSAFEFQMLYGIRRDLQRKLVAEGFGVRVYIPFGTEWYPYFMRRLAERPANVLFLAKNFFKS